MSKMYIIDAIERNLIQLKASENKRQLDLFDFYCYQFCVFLLSIYKINILIFSVSFKSQLRCIYRREIFFRSTKNFISIIFFFSQISFSSKNKILNFEISTLKFYKKIKICIATYRLIECRQ